MAVEIIEGVKGYFLKVDGLFIRIAKFGSEIIALKPQGLDKYGILNIPFGATEWIDVNVLRAYWSCYRLQIIASLAFPYRSTWGEFERITEKES